MSKGALAEVRPTSAPTSDEPSLLDNPGACGAGRYAAAYRLVNGNWERYFPNRPDISNMGPLNRYDAFLILVTAPVTCFMPTVP